ncbi:MAG: DsbA family protein [Patescibacteria group bacterium]
MAESEKIDQAIRPWYLKGWGLVFSIALIAVLIWLIGLVMWLYNPFAELGGTSRQAVNPLSVDEDDDPAWGSVYAKVTIISFEDYTCPVCGEAYEAIKQIRENYYDDVYIVFRDFPILGPTSTTAALAAECAEDQGKFWEMHDKLFENQTLISEEYVKAFAAQIGLDLNTFTDCLYDNEHRAEIQSDLSEGIAAGVEGTPTWFIEGTRLEGAIPYEVWEQIIDSYI